MANFHGARAAMWLIVGIGISVPGGVLLYNATQQVATEAAGADCGPPTAQDGSLLTPKLKLTLGMVQVACGAAAMGLAVGGVRPPRRRNDPA